MRKLVVMVSPDQVNGYRLAGLEAYGVDDAELASNVIGSWLDKNEDMLLAIGESVYSLLDKNLIERIHASEKMLLVTIPDSPVPPSSEQSQKEIFDSIRHAMGVNLRFKGEANGTKS